MLIQAYSKNTKTIQVSLDDKETDIIMSRVLEALPDKNDLNELNRLKKIYIREYIDERMPSINLGKTYSFCSMLKNTALYTEVLFKG